MAKTDGVILRVAGVAELLGVSGRTVRRLAASGKLPPLDKGEGKQGSYIFDAGAVQRYLADREAEKAS